MEKKPHVNVVYKPVVREKQPAEDTSATKPDDPFRRAENEDDDGYDPYSDRPADPVPLFEQDPWS